MPEKMLYARSNGGLNPRRSSDHVDRCLLLDHAVEPDEPLVQAYATVIGRHCDATSRVFVPALGLDMPVFRGLLVTYFPHFIAPSVWLQEQHETLGATGALSEFRDLVQLLVEHCAIDDEHHRCVTHLVATACMGNDHLWQDLGLPHRSALSELLTTCFPALAAKNRGDMKWKKFFYKQLCEREGIRVCKAPSCAACSDYAKCFGPEE